MRIMSKWNELVQRNRDAAILSVMESRALTNFYDGCHGDFANLPDQYTARTELCSETGAQRRPFWRAALAQ